MPFYRRTVLPRSLCPSRAALQLVELRDVCSLASLTLLRQLADLCGHSLALLGEIEGHLLALGRRAGRLRHRMSRLQGLLHGRPHPRAPATSNLDLESKKTPHSKLPWQQPVNVFLAAGRSPCVEELHQEAQFNLQSLLQEEYEEQYTEARVTGQTFRNASHLPLDAPPEPSPRALPAKRLEFVFMPAARRVNEDEATTLGVRPPEPFLSLPTTPDKQPAWTRAFPLPTVEEKRWHQSCSIQANIVPINVSGQLFDRHASARHSLFNTETAVNPKSTLRRRRTIIGFPNLALRDQGNSNGPTFTPHATIGESVSCSFVPEAANGKSAPRHPCTPQPPAVPLRKTFSDLGGGLQARCCQPPARMEGTAVACTSPACNGPKDATFSPPWNTASFNCLSPAEEDAVYRSPGGSPGSPGLGSPERCDGAASFFIAKDEQPGSNGPCVLPCTAPESTLNAASSETPEGREAKVTFLASGAEGAAPSRLELGGRACPFRERSLSVPTDSGSLCSVDITYPENRRGSGTYALSYPSASSEGSTSTDNISLGVEQDAQRRRRSKSISLKKAKKKPSPPMRSVSLIKDGQGLSAEPGTALPKELRPKSLCLPLDPQGCGVVPMDTQGNTAVPPTRDLDGGRFSQDWCLADWKASDPYRSLSGSSTATGTTVIECTKAQGSSESLPSPSISRATTPSQLSAEVELKSSSPGRPVRLMSPSSGYSSQSETPTPTIPTSAILGHSPHQTVKVRPLVPERKSSLPPPSPMEKSPKSRLSFDLPITPLTHLDLSGLKISLKGKTKVSRHHSDSTFGTKLGPKTSPIQPVMPVVTQSDLRSVRLRSVSRSEPEDDLDSPDRAEEHEGDAIPLPGRKAKPPVAEKPPLAKRPPNIMAKPPPLQEESTLASPTSPPMLQGTSAQERGLQDIYMVIRKPKPKRSPEARSPGELPSPLAPSQGCPGIFFSGLQRLSQSSLEEEPRAQLERSGAPRGPEGEKRKAKVPPPVPKKPSVLYLPLTPPPPHLGACLGDPRLTPSPIITLHEDTSCCDPDADYLPSPEAMGKNSSPPAAAMPGQSPAGDSVELSADERSFVSDKTAESIVEEDDDVFVTTRTTEDLFTVIHRSKRKLLGWKEPGDAFSSRQNSHSPVKNPAGLPACESPPAAGGPGRASSRNEDFKALLQKKGSKASPGTRTSAAELLKSTNPLARRVMMEFAPELDNPSGARTQP
ncbi:NHS-like protein 2 isoform X2 [Chelonia mydas]|uniref:NHS-like protein 2 isoform X2 n=2 Tax=Chelonia mydas TaxID=8469 RepID=UPI001CA82A79|nr:NHS-like protein 2 isoform X2 [Chelonia mydas]